MQTTGEITYCKREHEFCNDTKIYVIWCSMKFTHYKGKRFHYASVSQTFFTERPLVPSTIIKKVVFIAQSLHWRVNFYVDPIQGFLNILNCVPLQISYCRNSLAYLCRTPHLIHWLIDIRYVRFVRFTSWTISKTDAISEKSSYFILVR